MSGKNDYNVLNFKKTVIIIIVAFVLAVIVIGIWPSIYVHDCKTRVYDDMNIMLVSDTYTMESNIRIISISEKVDGDDISTAYGAGASGVIFGKKDDRYYAMTANHVVEDPDADRYVVANISTPSYSEYNESHDQIMGQEAYYNELPELKIEYQNAEADPQLSVTRWNLSESQSAEGRMFSDDSGMVL